ncbi:MAG: carboxymuconolactone decarboxylase family protein [Novosphingobium sp.]|nr:carboxymuconolactone decarboxylase family protein [Novosphingobium sp.]
MSPSRVQSGPTPFDLEAREAQVASGDQRISPLELEEFTEEAQKIATDLQAFFGSREKGIPKTFATMFKHPGLYRGQMQLGLELNQNGTLPPREREMVILRTAWLVRSPFEWGEHVTYGKKLGLTSEEIERITQGSSAPGWNEHDRAVLRGVEELIGDHAVSDETWAILARTWSEQQLMELPGLVGSYTLTAMIYNTLRFGLLEGNEGFNQR